LVVAGAAGYAAFGLRSRELSLLESQDLSVAESLFKTYALTADHSPLHFVFLSFWQRLSSSSEAFLRLPSVAFAALAALLVYRVGERASGKLAGPLAALCFATNPLVVDQARSLRLYALSLLLAALCLERAQAYWIGQDTLRSLRGFAFSAVLAIYNHLFLWLAVGPLALALALSVARTEPPQVRRRAVRYTLVSGALLIPQLIHGLVAVLFTQDRHAIYRGVSSEVSGFAGEIARCLLLGEAHQGLPIPTLALALPVLLALWGAWKLGPVGRWSMLVVVGLPLLAAWVLSIGSQVEPRYVGFVLPGFAALLGVGLSRLPRAVVPLAALPLLGAALLASSRAYAGPATDWFDGAKRLEAIKRPGDVVAVFPGYWAPTLQRYSALRELVPVSYPSDLDRVLSRGERVLLVVNGGRYFGDMDAYLNAYARRSPLFDTKVRDTFEVDAITLRARRTRAPKPRSGALVFVGLVGSGGYGWQAGASLESPFNGLAKVLRSGDAAIAVYAPYDPPWSTWLTLGASAASTLAPNRVVADALREAGIGTVVLACSHGAPEKALPTVAGAGLGTVAIAQTSAEVAPTFVDAGGRHVALLSLGARVGSLGDAELVRSVVRARARIGAEALLVAFVPQEASYAAMPTDAARSLAHRAVDAGADVVLGVGGYAAQPIEHYAHGVIAYSLGTLLRPPSFSFARSDSTGIALRVTFEQAGAPSVEAYPTTFDDLSRPVLGRANLLQGIEAEAPDAPPGRYSLDQRMRTSQPSFVGSDGKRRTFGAFHPEMRSNMAPWPERLWVATRWLTEWIPQYGVEGALRPFAGGYSEGGSYFGVRAVRSLGVWRPAIELDARGGALSLDFPKLVLGQSLEVAYALPDDRERSKFRPLLDQTVSLGVDGTSLLTETLPFQVGWHTSSLDTKAFAGAPRTLRITLQPAASHFPVAFAVTILP
jgi:4-amino-4-deoxy-L-arabinose transferase-like glycosyltransferase